MGSGAHPGGSRLSKLLRLIEGRYRSRSLYTITPLLLPRPFGHTFSLQHLFQPPTAGASLAVSADGSSLETRKAAGEQIAGIVAAHPAQLPSVIRQVSIFLRHKDWDARTAAGHCLGAIAQRVQHHTPASIAQAAGVDRTHLTPQRAEAAEEAAAPAATLSDAQPPMGAVSAGGVRHVYDETSQTMAGPESYPPLLSLASFNVSQVLEQGVQLLASAGDEYVEHEAADLSQQRANLKRRLGLGTGTDAFLDTADIFGDEDLVNNGAVAGAASAVTKASDEAPQMKTMQDSNQLTAATDILADMAGGSSARERAAAVRKAKAAKRRAGTLPTAIGSEQPASKRAKSDDKGSTRPSVDAEDHGNTVQMIDADVVEKEWQEIVSGHWPFQALCNQLSVDVLHPTWEVRHGAALGLRDILTSQAAAAAVVAPLADPPGGCWLAAGGTGRPELSHVSAADAVQAASANARWLEDCCVHLLCALALDRFDDFLSDQVVAPVRETAAQALGAAARPLSSAAIGDLVNCLRALVEGVHWQPRHGGLQGLKYVLAAREVDASLLAGALPATIAGLKDADDDVRAVAAEALLPAAAVLARDGSPEGLHARGLVWDALLGDDELSPAVKGATMLLAALHSSTILDAGRLSDESTNAGAGLPELVPRLWPHLGHNLSSVRRATLQCLFALLKAHSVAVLLPEVEELRRAGRLLFQRILLETDDAVLEEALNTWEVLVRRASGTELAAAFTTAVLTSLFALASTPPHTKLPMKHVIAAQRDSHMHAHGCDPRSSISNTNDMTMGDAERAARGRLFASKALGQLACALENRCQMGQPNHSVDIILDCLKSTSASARVLGGYTCVHWARLALPERFHSSGNASSASSSAMPANLKRVVDAALEQLGAPPPQYQELASLYLQVQARATALLQLTQGRGEQLTLPQGATSASLGADAALYLAAQVPANASKEMLASARALQAAATTLQTPEAVLRTSASAALAGAVVVHGAALPAKLNVLIQPLIAAVRREPHAALQSQAADSLARLALLVTSRSPSPTDKILKNVCGFACGDPVAIPSAVQPPSLDDGVLETKANGTTANGVKSTSKSQAAKGAIAAAPTSITSTAEPPSAFALTRRGGEAMLRALALHAGTDLLQLLPTFWSHHVRAPIEAIVRAHQQAGTASIDALQAAIHALRVLEVIAPVMHPDAVLCAVQLLPLLSTCLCQVNAAVQLAASRTLSSLAAAQPIIVMPPALGVITPLLAADKPDAARLGGVLALRESVRALGLRMVPYVQLAIIPLLGRMSDSVSLTRTVASRCFADVVSLVPLAHGIARPSGLSPEQEASLEREGGFLTRLLDNSQVEDVQLPFKLQGGASLRRYQQEGVNWLAFLRRFGLHGVLADGKYYIRSMLKFRSC
jgi:TATA-binding protein-associated factor